MNPSPSGYFDSGINSTPSTQRYLSRISGPLLDRIDLHIEVSPVPFDELSNKSMGESSFAIRNRVAAARAIQQARFKDYMHIHYNAQMYTKQLRAHCHLPPKALSLL